MTDSVKHLISYVADGNVKQAQKCAIQILEANTSKKDELYCKSIAEKLKSKLTTMEIPANISSFVTLEDITQTFVEDRYFLTEREKQLFDKITIADKAREILAEKRIRHLNSTMLFGESGTGKTTFGRYVAYKLGIPFIYLNFTHIVSSLLGQTGQNIKRVFDFVKQQRCVFMLDEFDAIAAERGDKNDVTEMARTVNTLIQALDTLGNNIILIAATNRYDIIDAAICRRFTRVCEVYRLKIDGLGLTGEHISFAKKYLSSCGYDITEEDIYKIIGCETKQSKIEEKLIDYIIARETDGFLEGIK